MFNPNHKNLFSSKFVLVILVVCVLSFFQLSADNITSFDPVNAINLINLDNQVLQQRVLVSEIFPRSIIDQNLITVVAITTQRVQKTSSNVYDGIIISEFEDLNSQLDNLNNKPRIIPNQIKVVESVIKVDNKTHSELNELVGEADPIDSNVLSDTNLIFEKNIFDTRPVVHKIILTDSGFVPQQLKINVGDKVIWLQQRETFNVGTIYGTGKFIDIRSLFLNFNETFEHTFVMDGVMTYVDVISKHQVGKLSIEQ